MSAVERAAQVLHGELDWLDLRALTAAAEVLADAGLLITDEDRAVLDAAEAWQKGSPRSSLELSHAVRARREAQR